MFKKQDKNDVFYQLFCEKMCLVLFWFLQLWVDGWWWVVKSMVPIFDGNSELGAHVLGNLCYLIWLRHLNLGFFAQRRPIFQLISDGNLERGAHVRSNRCYLICLRHWIEQEESRICFFAQRRDGNSELGANVLSNLCYLICLRHLIRTSTVTNRFF